MSDIHVSTKARHVISCAFTASQNHPLQDYLARTPVDEESLCTLGAANALPDKKLSYCWETVRRESMLRIAEMDVEMTT